MSRGSVYDGGENQNRRRHDQSDAHQRPVDLGVARVATKESFHLGSLMWVVISGWEGFPTARREEPVSVSLVRVGCLPSA